MSQLVQTPSKGCAESVKDALFCMWLKIHPRLECVHQLVPFSRALWPLSPPFVCPSGAVGVDKLTPWPSPQPLPLLPPLSRGPLPFTCSHSSSPSTLFSSCPIFLKAPFSYWLSCCLKFKALQPLALKREPLPSVLMHHVLGLHTTLWCASKVAPKFGGIAHCVLPLLASLVPRETFKGSKREPFKKKIWFLKVLLRYFFFKYWVLPTQILRLWKLYIIPTTIHWVIKIFLKLRNKYFKNCSLKGSLRNPKLQLHIVLQ